MPRFLLFMASHLVMILVLATYFPQSESLKLNGVSAEPHKHPADGPRKPLAEGCSLVYLDIGSNIGVQVRKLFEPQKYPRSRIFRSFDKHFGSPHFRKQPFNVTGLCAFGFEANPRFAGHLRKIQDAYTAKNWRVEFIAPRIVSDVDNRDITFYIDSDEGSSEWGSSITPHSGNMTAVTVKTLDFVSWFEKEILPVNPRVVVAKMDIEGSEYLVLPRLLEKQLLCKRNLAYLMLEWHKHKFYPKGMTQGRGSLERAIAAQTCTDKTPISPMDDEKYVKDGMPLPGNVGFQFRTTPGFIDSNINISKALYKAAYLDYLKRSGIPAGTQGGELPTNISE